jgi:hypothetical protein
VAVIKPVPVRVTLLPPVTPPVVGDNEESVGGLTKRNTAPLLVAEVVSIVTALAPAPRAGEVALTLLSEMTVKDVAGVGPKWTASVSINPDPVIVTSVPPAVGPEAGVMEEITGDGWNSKLSELSVPPWVVIMIGTVPARCIGVTASTSVSLTTVKFVAATDPNDTLVVPARLVPVIVTVSPPAVMPVVGNTAVGEGAAT